MTKTGFEKTRGRSGLHEPNLGVNHEPGTNIVHNSCCYRLSPSFGLVQLSTHGACVYIQHVVCIRTPRLELVPCSVPNTVAFTLNIARCAGNE